MIKIIKKKRRKISKNHVTWNKLKRLTRLRKNERNERPRLPTRRLRGGIFRERETTRLVDFLDLLALKLPAGFFVELGLPNFKLCRGTWQDCHEWWGRRKMEKGDTQRNLRRFAVRRRY